MRNLILAVLALLLLNASVHAHLQPTARCPTGPGFITLHHGHLAISTNSLVAIQVGVDSLCYEYPLPSPFQ